MRAQLRSFLFTNPSESFESLRENGERDVDGVSAVMSLLESLGNEDEHETDVSRAMSK